MLERAEEELDLIAQELGRAMTWAVELHTKIKRLASLIVGTLDQSTGQQVLKFELYIQLADHHEMMRFWRSDVEWLWGRTRAPGSSHVWFETIGCLDINDPTRRTDSQCLLNVGPTELFHETQRIVGDPQDYNVRGRHSLLTFEDREFIIELVRTEPGLFLDEMRERSYDHGGTLVEINTPANACQEIEYDTQGTKYSTHPEKTWGPSSNGSRIW
ncbi:hypothetical protein PSTG_15488 [Puccinia striiformis f. sp. tritici PST-78]|uniref:Uncharacterized protein n=1 Tax=Puccinia striiformis f. sp. tritici PST-78 TaxID=1165861 RepID=A0A0L0UVL9_9BASI|nr:hypothetical protein PSTG_15488 [Puccinia striiformis f. sp. tritici PST-78]